MKYSDVAKPGMGDPTWYEWSVGQQYIIDMLDDAKRIKCVELQANVSLGLDDVVVTYQSGHKRFVQVKHTRVEDTLTFGDLVSSDEEGSPLLSQLAQSWQDEKGKYQSTEVLLFTNRKVGIKASSAKKNGSGTSSSKGEKLRRPALKTFWCELKRQLQKAKSLSDVVFPEYQDAWEEWKAQLTSIKTDEDKLAFLNCLTIETDQLGLDEIKDDLIHRICTVFATDAQNAEIILGYLDHALRKWTTSSREKSSVTAEDVVDAVAVSSRYVHYNHDFIPSQPFFTSRDQLVGSLENELREGTAKVVFLSGNPGAGKTNLVSRLCAKRDCVIDIRYYAYEPIDPSKEYCPLDVSRRVNRDYFWNELFDQLRNCLRGHLHKYGVPVLNQLMTLEEMRRRFFQIASAWATNQGRNFIIAVDGIDHAARAGVETQTFLPTLPAPEYIPDNVKFLLAGQPKEHYAEYPAWLFLEDGSVKEIPVPNLQEDDVYSLVQANFPDTPDADRRQLSALISEYVEGNTLAAVFAVHEALQQPDPQELEKRLADRKLSGNIKEYYKNIWDNSVRRIRTPFLDYKMAGVLAFFNEPLDGDTLAEIYPFENISPANWRNVLKSLRPLLIEREGCYTILHNDVRVFLSSIIGQDMDHVQEAYSALADYYMSCERKTTVYYHDIFHFLKGAGRLDEFNRIYSPDFVIEAYVSGVELSELRAISADILNELLTRDPLDWTKLRDLAFGYMTIGKLEDIAYEIEDSNYRKSVTHIPIHANECRVEPRELWNADLIFSVLNLTETLYEAGQNERAIGLFRNWFTGLSAADILIPMITEERHGGSFVAFGQIACHLGRFACLFDERGILTRAKVLCDDARGVTRQLMKSAISTLFATRHGVELADALSHLEVIFVDHLMPGIRDLLADGRFDDLACTADALRDYLAQNPSGTLVVAFIDIISNKLILDETERTVLWEQVSSVKLTEYAHDFELAPLFYSVYAVVSAYLRPEPYGKCAKDVLEYYFSSWQHHNVQYYSAFFENLCLLGKWLSPGYRGTNPPVSPPKLHWTIESLLLPTQPYIPDNPETARLHSLILRAYISCAEQSAPEYCQVVDEICERLFADLPCDILLDAGLFYYRTNAETLRGWFDKWLGNCGLVWEMSLGERNRFIHELEHLWTRYHLEDVIDFGPIRERAQWSVIGYASHKEYSCDYLLDWYNSIVKIDRGCILDCAAKVKRISNQVTNLGDNRPGFQVNTKIFEDVFSCNFHELEPYLRENLYLSQGIIEPELLVSGLIGALQYGRMNEQSILELWAMGTALLDWRDDNDHAAISSLQRAVELCAERSDIEGISDTLRALTPAYADLSADTMTFIVPDHWCDPQPLIDESKVSKSLLDAYLAGDTKGAKESVLYLSAKALRERGEIGDDYLAQLLHCNLSQRSVGINRSELVEYLFKALPSETSDSILRNYLRPHDDDGFFDPGAALSYFALWKIGSLDGTYGKSGLEELIQMYKSWMTAAGRFPQPSLPEQFNYEALIDWESISDIKELFYQLILLIVQSEDAGAIRNALAGVFTLLRVNSEWIACLERDWGHFHYQTKEWLMMIYELLWDMAPDSRSTLLQYITVHCSDPHFNVALYANLLRENILGSDFSGHIKSEQPFFDRIPDHPMQMEEPQIFGPFVKTFAGYATELMELVFAVDGRDLIKRAVSCMEKSDCIQPLPLPRQRVTPYVHVYSGPADAALLRVLYRDWVAGIWDDRESMLARIVLSVSEPYVMLFTPPRWVHGDGRILQNVTNFYDLDEFDKRAAVLDVLRTGLTDDETIAGGCIVEYTHRHRIFGFVLASTTQEESGGEVFLAHDFNMRVFLQNREDFAENGNQYMSLRNVGRCLPEMGRIYCCLSKTMLQRLEWHIDISPGGLAIRDASDCLIGRFEQFAGKHDSSNRYPNNQPMIQRWVVNKKMLADAQKRHGDGATVQSTTRVIINNILQ